MASQRRFEGPVLEDLLDRVRSEAGAGAHIVAANRVRKGGLGGFFTREYFEVIVDVLDIEEIEAGAEDDDDIAVAIEVDAATVVNARPVAAAAPTGTRRVPASILDLAEAVNDSERDTRRIVRAPALAPVASNADHTVIDLVDDDEPATPPTQVPQSAPPMTNFAQLLERLASEPQPASTPLAGEPDDDDEVIESPLPRRRRPQPGADGVADEDEHGEARVIKARRSATAARVTSDHAAVEQATAALIQPTAFGAIADPAQPASFRRVPRNEAVLERPENALARLGLPARLVPRGTAPNQLRGALIESLAALPSVPAVPDSRGVVIAVVGTGAAAVFLARELCAEYGLDPERIVLATQQPLGEGIPAWLQICDGATAEERRRSWRRRSLPTIVAVNLPPGRSGLTWAREILDQLEPTIAWSIVSAGWKPEDVRDWIERLGGVDAMALTNLDDTVSPAAALDLGLPVGRLDGKPATAIAWSELLVERLQS